MKTIVNICTNIFQLVILCIVAVIANSVEPGFPIMAAFSIGLVALMVKAFIEPNE